MSERPWDGLAFSLRSFGSEMEVVAFDEAAWVFGCSDGEGWSDCAGLGAFFLFAVLVP